MHFNNFTTCTANGTTTIVGTSDLVHLHTITVPKALVGSITVEDVTGTPVVYFVLPALTAAGTYIFDSVLPNGLIVVSNSASDAAVVVNWRQG